MLRVRLNWVKIVNLRLFGSWNESSITRIGLDRSFLKFKRDNQVFRKSGSCRDKDRNGTRV